ncbi:MAG: hypothetical protein D4R66_08105 [Opitutales bacterium]|nr:MAG: hypothetical protein D4R66_08105 [Opitutales bacterium]
MAYRSLFLVLSSSLMVACAFAANEAPGTKNQEQVAEPFRPEAGKFPPFEKAHTYQGELTFVDHANRRGSLRVQGPGIFRSTEPNPFAILPYGMVRYQGAPGDLRDIPLGTILHVTAFLPPDPKLSSVPVLPVDNRNRDANHRRGVGVFPAENHALLVEDEPSYCQRMGLTWKLKEAESQDLQGTMTATLASNKTGEKPVEQKLNFDQATRFWRGRDCLTLTEVVAEGILPASGKKAMEGRSVLLGLTWKPTPGGVFLRYHVSDVWLDASASERAAKAQTETHKTFVRSRWVPGWVDRVEYGKFGRATVTVTLFGGMDPALYADFQKSGQAYLNGAENTLKYNESGSAGPTQMAARGPIVEVRRQPGDIPTCSSGLQVRFETDLITEGIRPTKIVRMRPASWPDVHLPREEYINGNSGNLEERFPTPAIFPKY